MNLHFAISPFVEMNINSSIQSFAVVSRDAKGLEIKVKPDGRTGDLQKLLEQEKVGRVTFRENESEPEKTLPIRLQAVRKQGQELFLKCVYC